MTGPVTTRRRGPMPAAALALVTVLALLVPGPAAGHGPVQRLGGGTRAETAARVAADGWPRGTESAVLVDGYQDRTALIGAHLAARLGVPVLLGGAAAVPVETEQAIADLGVQEVLAVGEVEVPEGLVHRRIQAADDLALAAAAARHPTEGSPPVVLAGLDGTADALAAANLAPVQLLLTRGDALSGEAAEVIRELAPPEVVILGGVAVVAEQVVQDIEALGPTVRRVAGANRIETALAAVTWTGTSALTAAGTFADALAVVPWAARRQSAVLLTPHDELPEEVEGPLREIEHHAAYVLGGTAAVGNFVERQAVAALSGEPPPGFVGGARFLTVAEQEAMLGVTWRDGCPVPLDDLRAVDLAHWGLDGNVVDDGLLIVHASVAEDMTEVMARLFDARFPLARVRPAHEHGGDDDALMAADVTSAFNCRTVAGTSTWSEHAYGWAVDINPVQNPYVRDGVVQPAAGEAYLDRADVRPGMAVEGGPLVAAFDALGWGWGGRWQRSKDYQHFSLTGR